MKPNPFTAAAVTLLAALLLALSAESGRGRSESDTRPPHNSLGQSDQAFLQDLAQLNQFAMALGELAAVQGRDREIRARGKELAATHHETLRQLRQLAAGQGVMLPARLAPGTAREVDALKEKRGEPFDQSFIALAMRIHQESILLYEQAALGKGDAEIREWARARLPEARRHLTSLRESYPEAVGEELKPQTDVGNR